MVATKGMKYPDQDLYLYVVQELDKRHINIQTVGRAAYQMQHQYYPNVTVEQFGRELESVLKKREVLNILATGLALDNLAQDNQLPAPLQQIVSNDMGEYGIDELLAIGLSQLYGTISTTNYGHADKEKIGLAAKLDNSRGVINTFADDLFLALSSAVVGRFGHGSALVLKNKEAS